MFRVRNLTPVSLVVVSVSLTAPAKATTVTIGAAAPAIYTATVFSAGNGADGPGVWTFTGLASTESTSVGTPTYCLDPVAGGATNYYVCTRAASSVTADFSGGITGLDITWGTPDAYDKLTFYTGLNATGAPESFVPGVPPLTSTVPVFAAPVLFVADPGTIWKSVQFSSVFDSFEFGDIATLAASPGPASVPAPEPASLLPLFGGVLVLAGGIRRMRIGR